MTDFLGRIFGVFFRFVYDTIIQIGSEPKSISYYAITVIIMTIIFRILQLPLGIKQNKEMKKMARVQPKIQEIQTKYKSDPNTMNAKLTKLMQEEKYNPMGGCLPLLIQFPIIMGFWRVMQQPEVYVFADGIFNTLQLNFFWIKDLKQPDLWILPILSGGLTFLSQWLTTKGQVKTQTGDAAKQAESMQKSMMIMLPVMIVWMGRTMAAGLTLYWTVSTLFQIVQQQIFNINIKHETEEAMEEAEGLKRGNRKIKE